MPCYCLPKSTVKGRRRSKTEQRKQEKRKLKEKLEKKEGGREMKEATHRRAAVCPELLSMVSPSILMTLYNQNHNLSVTETEMES